MNNRVFGIMVVLIFTVFGGLSLYSLNMDFQKAKDYSRLNLNMSEVFLETPETSAMEIKISKLKKIEVEPDISNSKKQEILLLLAKLYTTEKAILEKVKAQLLTRADGNIEERDFIIFHLLDNVNCQDSQLVYSDPEKRNVWTVSIDILADLEAEEGVKYFVQCLDFGMRVKRTFHNVHTFNAVLKLKEKSVPSLIISLRFGRPEIRMGSAEALGEIGGEMSKKALESALITEQDDWVKSVIKQSLRALKQKCEQHNYFQECSNHSWNF